MKNALKVATVLSWINIVIWGLATVNGLVMGLGAGSMQFLIMAFFCSVFVLHSYATLQLRKSILHGAPLKEQTATGIRFIGLIVLMIGMLFLFAALVIIPNAGAMLTAVQEKAEVYKSFTPRMMRILGVYMLLLGLAMTVNVILSFRLLRWFLQSRPPQDPSGDA